jgi:hypothetical protein
MRDIAIAVGLLLLVDRFVAWGEGKYQPDWVGIAGGLLMGFALAKFLKENV